MPVLGSCPDRQRHQAEDAPSARRGRRGTRHSCPRGSPPALPAGATRALRSAATGGGGFLFTSSGVFFALALRLGFDPLPFFFLALRGFGFERCRFFCACALRLRAAVLLPRACAWLRPRGACVLLLRACAWLRPRGACVLLPRACAWLRPRGACALLLRACAWLRPRGACVLPLRACAWLRLRGACALLPRACAWLRASRRLRSSSSRLRLASASRRLRSSSSRLRLASASRRLRSSSWRFRSASASSRLRLASASRRLRSSSSRLRFASSSTRLRSSSSRLRLASASRRRRSSSSRLRLASASRRLRSSSSRLRLASASSRLRLTSASSRFRTSSSCRLRCASASSSRFRLASASSCFFLAAASASRLRLASASSRLRSFVLLRCASLPSCAAPRLRASAARPLRLALLLGFRLPRALQPRPRPVPGSRLCGHALELRLLPRAAARPRLPPRAGVALRLLAGLPRVLRLPVLLFLIFGEDGQRNVGDERRRGRSRERRWPAPQRAAIRTATPRRTTAADGRFVGRRRSARGAASETPRRPGLDPRTTGSAGPRTTCVAGSTRLRLELEVRHPLLQRVDRFGLALGRGLDERPDFVGEEVRIAAAHRRPSAPASFLPSSLPNSPPPLFCSMSAAVDASCGMVWVWMCCAPGERAQVGDELLLVARREQRGEEDDVGDPRGQRRHRRVARIDQDEIRADLLANDALEDGGLTVVRLDSEDERQGLRPYHEEKEHGADGGKDHERSVLDALIAECSTTRVPPRSISAIVPGGDAVAAQTRAATNWSRTRGSTQATPADDERESRQRQQQLAKFHGVILESPPSQCVCRRQICTRARAVSDAHTRNRCERVRVAHKRPARSRHRDAHQIRVMPYETAPAPASLAEVIWRPLARALRVPPARGNRRASEGLASERRAEAPTPWHSRCDWLGRVSRQARRSYQPHAALPQVTHRKEAVHFLGGGFNVDATEFREVGCRNEEGQDLLEYALLVALIALIAIGAVGLAGQSVSTIFTNIAGQLDGGGVVRRESSWAGASSCRPTVSQDRREESSHAIASCCCSVEAPRERATAPRGGGSGSCSSTGCCARSSRSSRSAP